MIRVDEMLTPAIVGKFYLVPGIEYKFFDWKGWFPVMGTLHEDAEHVGFPHDHYHPDWRFMPEWALEHATGEMNRLGADDDIYRWPLWHAAMNPHPPITYKRRKCRRIAPLNTLMARVPKGRALHDAWYGKDARRGPNGFICPHRGTPLGSVPINPDGTITCPLHGLKFCAKTGKSMLTQEPTK